MQQLLKQSSRIGATMIRSTVVRCSMQGDAPSSARFNVKRLFTALNKAASKPHANFPKLNPKVNNPFKAFSSGGGSGGNFGGGGGGGGGDGEGAARGLWNAYLALLKRSPLATKAVTAALLNGLGDVIAQVTFEKGTFDLKRLGIFAFLGLVLIGPSLHFWYGSLSTIVTLTGTPGALCRLALDQLCFAPIFIGSILSSIMVLEGHSNEVPSKLKSDLFTIVKSNWTLWVPFQFVNFRFVPVNLQVLAANVVALAWNTYMSWVSHR